MPETFEYNLVILCLRNSYHHMIIFHRMKNIWKPPNLWTALLIPALKLTYYWKYFWLKYQLLYDCKILRRDGVILPIMRKPIVFQLLWIIASKLNLQFSYHHVKIKVFDSHIEMHAIYFHFVSHLGNVEFLLFGGGFPCNFIGFSF